MYYLFIFLYFFFPSLVLAHHPLAGGPMLNFSDGFLSGIGHPILGLDHLAFIFGIGLISYLSRNLLNYSVTFIGGTLVGLFSIIFGFFLPFYELIISFTLLILGYFIISKNNNRFKKLIFSIFGIFHGWAYGAILSNEVKLNIDVVLGYSLGLLITQLFIIFLGFSLIKNLYNFRFNNFSIIPVFSGVIVGIAVVNLFEIIESGILNFLS